MSVLETIGPFSAVYVGNATSSEPLTLIDAERTEGAIYTYSQPLRWIQSIKKYRPAGNAKFKLDMTFYHGESDILTKLALGASLDAANTNRADKPGGQQQYTLFAAHVSEDIKMSLYIPVIETERNYSLPTGKKFPKFTLTFMIEDRNSLLQLWYKDTAAAAAAMVTNSRNPFD
jgi:hypothetical protein